MTIQDDHIRRAVMDFEVALEEYHTSKGKTDISPKLLRAKEDAAVTKRTQLISTFNELVKKAVADAEEEFRGADDEAFRAQLEHAKKELEEKYKNAPKYFDILREQILDDVKQIATNLKYIEAKLETARLEGHQNPGYWTNLLSWCRLMVDRIATGVEKVGK